MSLYKNTIGNIRGYSQAMYSNWYYYRPGRVLFDAGEGVSVKMRNFVFGIQAVFVTHGHHDHVGGIPGMVYARSCARGDKQKDLTIYHPNGWKSISAIRDYVDTSSGRREYELHWQPVHDGDRISINDGKERAIVEAFKVEHSSRGNCLGYRIIQKRHKLKPELEGLSNDEIRKIAIEKGRTAVRHAYEHVLLAYCGDSMPVKVEHVRGADVLIHDATFLETADRGRSSHATAREALVVAARADVKCVILTHVSRRYLPGAEDTIKETVRQMGLGIPVGVMIGSNLKML